MSIRKNSTSSGTGVVAACVAAVGTAVAIAYVLKRASQQRPGAVVDRCLRAVDELEQRMHGSAARA
jgi:hypothetical protein